MKKYIVEFIGTFFLVLTIVCTVNGGADIPPVAIGFALMVMVYAGGHISGAHYNPAVTLSVFLRGKCAAGDVAPYMICQVLGAALAAVLGSYVLGMAPAEAADSMLADPAKGITAEFLGTFALVWVVLHTATTKSTAGNSYYGLAIGLTVTAMAFALGGFGTGGCFNPAVAVGAAINGLAGWGTAALAIATNLVAGAVAYFVFNMVYDRMGDDD